TVVSLALFSLISLWIVLSHSIYIIMVLRFIQGFLVSFFAVAQRAIIVDIFKSDEKKLHSMANYIVIVWSIGPIVAPVIGGYLQHLFNWQVNFIFLILYSGLMCFLAIFFVPETLEKRIKLDINYMKESYTTILGNKSYILGFTCNGLLYILSISFSTIGAFLIERKMGYSPVVFGYCALLLGSFWFLGQMLNKILINYSTERKIMVASRINIVIALIALAWSMISFNIIQLILPLLFLNLSAAIVFGNYFIRNSTMFPRFAGNAGSLQGAGLLIITSIGGSIVNQFVSTSSAIPLITVYLLITVLCFVLTRMIKFNVK
ncbi:MAG: MFS transporter, partial [Neisseriaceae bacterium]